MSRNIVVTGAASGIGKSTAELLRARGDRVIGVDLHHADICTDLSTQDGRDEAVEEILEQSGARLDGVVASAGLSGVDPKLVAVNFFGAARLLTALRPTLANAQRPRAAVVSSVVVAHPYDAGIVDACLSDDEPNALALAKQAVADERGRQLYPSSKTALTRWVRRTCVAEGWADAGIPLNAVGPGVVKTPMSEPVMRDEQLRKAQAAAVPMPLGGHQGPETIASALAFLVSEENSHITGQMLYVDGGAEVTLRGPDTY